VIVTTWPAASTPVIGEYPARESGAARQASMFTFTAAASNGVPSWNVIPSRSVNVHSV
jgi:hypothetical protein